MSTTEQPLRDLLQEVDLLREQAADLENDLRAAERRAVNAEAELKQVREKNYYLERQREDVLDPLDEQFLWDNGATVRFKRKLEGGRVITIRNARNRVLSRRIGAEGAPLLREALDHASGRQRAGKKKQETFGRELR